MNNCKNCDDPCKYEEVEEICKNCHYDTMLFLNDSSDPCNSCVSGSNFKTMTESNECH